MPNVSLDPAEAEVEVDITGPAAVESGETLQDIREAVVYEVDRKAELLGADYETAPDYTQLDKWINRAYRDLCGSLELPEHKIGLSITTTAAALTYLLPFNVRIIDELVVEARYLQGHSRRLLPLDVPSFFAASDYSGEITRYGLHGRVLYIWPRPNVAETIQGVGIYLPDPLQSENEYPQLPPEIHEALILGAIARTYKGLKEHQLAADAWSGYRAFLRGRIDRSAQQDRNRIISVSVPRRRSELHRGVMRDVPSYVERDEY